MHIYFKPKSNILSNSKVLKIAMKFMLFHSFGRAQGTILCQGLNMSLSNNKSLSNKAL